MISDDPLVAQLGSGPPVLLGMAVDESPKTREKFEQYCILLEQGFTYKQIANMNRHPERTPESVMTRHEFQRALLLAKDPWFRSRFMQASAMQLLNYQSELVEITDNESQDWIEREEASGGEVSLVVKKNPRAIQRTRVMIETRQWLLEKLQPEFGPRMKIEGDPTKPHGTVGMTRDEYLELAKKAREEI